MASNLRTPPRFVPTLTTVLDMAGEPRPRPWPLMPEAEAQQAPLTGGGQSANAQPLAAVAADAAFDSASGADAVASETGQASTPFEDASVADTSSADTSAIAPLPAAAPPVLAPATLRAPENQIAIDVHALSDADAFSLEEQLMHRVLQRIDLSLEERLTDAVSAAVQQQLDAMVPHLRSEIESVLRSLVVEALSKELSDNTGSLPTSSPQSVG